MKSPEEIEHALTRLMPAALRPAAYEAICADIQDLAAERAATPAIRVALSIVEDSVDETKIVAPHQLARAETISPPITPLHPNLETAVAAVNLPHRGRQNVIVAVAAACVTLASGLLFLRSSRQSDNLIQPSLASDFKATLSSTSSMDGNDEMDDRPTNVLIDRREQVESEDASQLVTDDDGTVHRAYRIRRTTEEKVRDSATGLVITVTEPRDEELLIPVNSF